jgi:ribonuclease R
MSFPTEVLAQAEQTQVSAANRPQVQGLTIDDTTTWDIDDALHLELRPAGVRLQVSIADVAQGVPRDSALYEEAFRRAETLYFSEYKIPMLPPLLSDDRLSLLPQQPRPTLTFSLDLSPQWDVRQLHIEETALSSRRRLNHPQVDALLADPGDDPDAVLLRQLYDVAQLLFERRTNHGALVLADREDLWTATEEGLPEPLENAQHHKGHLIVQELMILTNKATAAYMAEQDVPFLYRNHVPRQNAPDRATILEQIHLTQLNPYWAEVFAARCQLWFQRATYGPILKGHFGLNEAAYSHVTSPIRRLPDLINHYQLKAHVNAQTLPFSQADLTSIAALIQQQMEDNRARYANESPQTIPVVQGPPGEALLAQMNTENFYQVLVQVCKEGVLHEVMAQALELRFNEQRLAASHLHLLAFEVSSKADEWSAVQTQALAYIHHHVGFAKMVLNIQQQKTGPVDLQVEIDGAGTHFWGRIVWQDAAGRRSTAEYAMGSNKKEVDHAASAAFLDAYLNDRLVPADCTIPPAEPPVSSPATGIEDNYIGQLNTYCQRQRWPLPRYQFTAAGEPHADGFVCTILISTTDGIQEASASTVVKQQAKQWAAKKGLEQLGVLTE